jgi:hypothetical protein
MGDAELTELDRAKSAWEIIFEARAAKVPLPTPGESHTDATAEDLLDIIADAAVSFEEFLETGTIDRDRVAASMLALLVARDFVLPLPDNLIPDSDLAHGLTTVRQERRLG